MRISTLLASKGDSVATITGDAPVSAAVEELRAHRIGALVVSADGTPHRRHRVRARRGAGPERPPTAPCSTSPSGRS